MYKSSDTYINDDVIIYGVLRIYLEHSIYIYTEHSKSCLTPTPMQKNWGENLVIMQHFP